MKNKAHYKTIFDNHFKNISNVIIVNSFIKQQTSTNYIVYFEIEKHKNSSNDLLNYAYIVVNNDDIVIYSKTGNSLPISVIKKEYYKAINNDII